MKGIFHTGITVSNLDNSIPFYRDTLGLKLVTGPTETFEGDELSQGVGVPGTKLRIAIFEVGEGSLELLEYQNPPSPIDTAMPPNTLGSMHVAFRVDNAVEKMKELEAKGITFLSELNVVDEGPLNGWRWAYFKDPDNITLEIVEIARPA